MKQGRGWCGTFNSLYWVLELKVRREDYDVIIFQFPILGSLFLRLEGWGMFHVTFNSLYWVPVFTDQDLAIPMFSFNSLYWVHAEVCFSHIWQGCLSIPYIGFNPTHHIRSWCLSRLSIPYIGFVVGSTMYALAVLDTFNSLYWVLINVVNWSVRPNIFFQFPILGSTNSLLWEYSFYVCLSIPYIGFMRMRLIAKQKDC